jgi:hypothetical protein
MLEYEIDPAFDVDKQPWYTGTVENVESFWGSAGPPPLPDDVPEIVKLALGDRVNRPVNVEIAISWVLATGMSDLSAPRVCSRRRSHMYSTRAHTSTNMRRPPNSDHVLYLAYARPAPQGEIEQARRNSSKTSNLPDLPGSR